MIALPFRAVGRSIVDLFVIGFVAWVFVGLVRQIRQNPKYRVFLFETLALASFVIGGIIGFISSTISISLRFWLQFSCSFLLLDSRAWQDILQS